MEGTSSKASGQASGHHARVPALTGSFLCRGEYDGDGAATITAGVGTLTGALVDRRAPPTGLRNVCDLAAQQEVAREAMHLTCARTRASRQKHGPQASTNDRSPLRFPLLTRYPLPASRRSTVPTVSVGLPLLGVSQKDAPFRVPSVINADIPDTVFLPGHDHALLFARAARASLSLVIHTQQGRKQAGLAAADGPDDADELAAPYAQGDM